MRRRYHALLLPLALALATSTSFAASSSDDDETPPDARLNGYVRGGATTPSGPLIITPASGTATTWLMIVVLGAASLGALCKSGKRTHMD